MDLFIDYSQLITLSIYCSWRIIENTTTALLYLDRYVNRTKMDQGEPGVDYDDNNLNPLVCDLCKRKFDSLDKLGEHQKVEHDM
jgi:hypothetical protein